VDTDGDSTCDGEDDDDDGDGWLDTSEAACGSDPLVANDTPLDTDGDGSCDGEDDDDDGDTWLDVDETACGSDPLSDVSVPVDIDLDAVCDGIDPSICYDVDGDGVWDGTGTRLDCPPALIDSDPEVATACADIDDDGCDDCALGPFDPTNDGVDSDLDGICDLGDIAVGDGTVCLDNDHDGCDDCSVAAYDPANDGTDDDGDGVCQPVDTLADDASLLLHYNFDDNYVGNPNPFGNRAASDGTYDGVGTDGAVFSVDPERGGVLSLPTAGDSVTATGFKGVLGTAARTLMAWVKTSANGDIIYTGTTSPNGALFQLHVGDALQVTGVLCVGIQGDQHCGTDVVADGNWHHVAVVAQANISALNLRLFVDGKLQPHSNGRRDRTVDTVAGADALIGGNFVGSLDDLRVYNRALSVAEVRAVFGPRPCTQDAHCDDGNACTTGTCLGTGVCELTSVTCSPSSCQQLWAEDELAADGDHTLFVDNDPTKGYSAHCADMAVGPRTYLNLANIDNAGGQTHATGQNFSHYGAGQDLPLLTIWYSRVSFNPVLLVVDTSDRRFTTTLGTPATNGNNANEFPTYASCGSCVSHDTAAGTANVDLRGTPFAVATEETWVPGGFANAGTANFPADPDPANPPHDDRKVVNITGGGFCGYNSPGPQNGKAHLNGAYKLDLMWQPDL